MPATSVPSMNKYRCFSVVNIKAHCVTFGGTRADLLQRRRPRWAAAYLTKI